MSILIKGMEMPNACTDCFACHVVEDELYCEPLDKELKLVHCGRLADCPLVSVPPHGRLGDLDKLALEMMDAKNADQVLAMLDDAPTIIPAEEVK